MDQGELVEVVPGWPPPQTKRWTSLMTKFFPTCCRGRVYWAVTVVLIVWYSLRFTRKPPLLAMSRSNPSTFACQGYSLDTRRCIFQNVVVQRGVIYYYAEDPLIATVPPMLCSMVNMPEMYAAPCDVRVISDPTAIATILAQTNKTENFNLGLALHRLNPGNAYHLLFEDMIPAMAMIYNASHITSNDPVPAILHTLKQQDVGIFLTDHHAGTLMDRIFWKEFYPEVTVLPLSNNVSYHVKTLVVGTRTNCVHWNHCKVTNRTRGIFDPPEAAAALRKVVFHRYGIVEEGDDTAAPASAPAAAAAPAVSTPTPLRRVGPPRVTLIRRSTTRRIRNLEEVRSTIESVMGVSPHVVDMSDLGIKDQVLLAHNTDIFILVHGGAMANLLWLPPRALIIDIYPHGFLISYHSSIIHWIRKALEPVIELGHMPFQIETAEGQELLTGPMVPGCVCRSIPCQIHVFGTSALIYVDVARFKEHLKEGFRAWKGAQRERGSYEKPVTPDEFERSQEEIERRRAAAPGYSSAPLCWEGP